MEPEKSDSAKTNENILTPELVEGRVAAIRFDTKHAPGAVPRQVSS
jgi:hypothetical protein